MKGDLRGIDMKGKRERKQRGEEERRRSCVGEFSRQIPHDESEHFFIWL